MAIHFIENLATVHVDGDRSGGAFALVELWGPEGDMPPLHVHHREDETFYVLEGRITFHAGPETVELAAGDCFLAPRDVPHTYRVESDGARWLVVGSPAGFDAFVREVGEIRPFDRARMGETAARYGIEILGPPGTLPA